MSEDEENAAPLDDAAPASVPAPTREEFAAARWFTLGFLLIMGAMMIGAIVLAIRVLASIT
jgi:hypothetical protein